MKNSIRFSVLALATAALAVSTGAFAVDTQTADLSVTANVAADCTIHASTLAFGNYFAVANTSAPLDSSATILYTCASGVIGKIVLSQGVAPVSGSTDLVPVRQMKNGSAVLTYNLYKDVAGGVVWDAVAGKTFLAGTGSVTVYGRVDAAQSPVTGSYTDTVVATISYL